MTESTLFEKILSGKIPANFIAKGETWGAFLDVFPRREGHTLVVPRNPVKHLSQLPQLEINELMQGVQQTQKILSKYFRTKDFTILIHDGPIAGQEIPHMHIHIIPRTEGDGGKTITSLFPETVTPQTPDFESLSLLHNKIMEASS
ncbi:MAG: HIT family protein [Candidatus Poseidoniaceae archaeon]|jgi:histidine triad (HIT) family protein|nr:HIT family protein [Candidatus Poseidoniaceae archaeon]